MVYLEVCDDGLPVEGGVRVPLVRTTLPLPAWINKLGSFLEMT